METSESEREAGRRVNLLLMVQRAGKEEKRMCVMQWGNNIEKLRYWEGDREGRGARGGR